MLPNLLAKSFVEEVLNKHNVTAVDKYYAPNFIQHLATITYRYESVIINTLSST